MVFLHFLGPAKAMSGMEKSGQWQRALQLLQAMETSQLLPDQVSFNAAIGACAARP